MNYKLTNEEIKVSGKTLYRIECIKDFKHAIKGEKGGFIEKKENLSGNAWVYGDARVSGNNDFCMFSGFGSENRVTTIMKTNNGIIVNCGCFNGSIKQFKSSVKIVYSKDNKYRKQYLLIIKLANLKLKK